jgi:hypothetical protein
VTVSVAAVSAAVAAAVRSFHTCYCHQRY